MNRFAARRGHQESTFMAGAAALPDGRADASKGAARTSERLADAWRPYSAPVIVFLASRTLLAVLAFAGPHVLGMLHRNRPLLPRSDPLAILWSWSSPWFRFDAGWYVGIAQHGYHWGGLDHANTNFMPLYPALIRLLQPITLGSPWLAALLVANLSFLAALLLLWRWALIYFDHEVSLRVLLLTVAFPFAFFFATPYAESLFLALAVATFLCAEQGRWLPATVMAGLCGITRPVGLAVILALLLLAQQRGGIRRVALACLALLPFLGYIVYLWLAFGQPLGFLTYHSAGWVPPHGSVITTIARQFHTHLSPLDRLDAALAAVFLASAIPVWRRLGTAYAAFVVVCVALPLLHGLVSMERYVIVAFPAFGAWAAWRPKLVQIALFSASLMLLVCATMMFAAGYSLF